MDPVACARERNEPGVGEEGFDERSIRILHVGRCRSADEKAGRLAGPRECGGFTDALVVEGDFLEAAAPAPLAVGTSNAELRGERP